MFPLMKSILSRMDSDYGDIRYEIKKETVVVFNGKELTQIGSNSTDGFVLRVLIKGGLSSIAFTKESDAGRAVQTVQQNALLIARNIKQPVSFAKAEPVKDT